METKWDLKGQWALITGASSGIGEATALAFAEKGSNLLLGARRVERLKSVADKCLKNGAASAQYHYLDVSKTTSVEEFVNWTKSFTDRLGVLVNNAGGAKGLDTVAEGKDEDWEFMIQTNVLGILRMCRACIPMMIKNPGSLIINIGSIAGRSVYEGGSVYCAAKAGELQITRALRLELCGTGVRVCTVDPGFAETEFSLVRFNWDKDRAKKVYEGMTPLKAQDIAEAILWVASRPTHVCIDELIIKPTDQAAIHKIYRRPVK
ncbi:MAG: SDR family NAD(P)-dependent oxidoreductase [Verrucomicrobiia bacterium]|jgi:NADP-dependent 3-hydroxy acid dehydrogenase YdfG